MIRRREFILYALSAGSICALNPRKSYASSYSIQLDDCFDRRAEFDTPPETIAPLGYYAQSVLYSINPKLLSEACLINPMSCTLDIEDDEQLAELHSISNDDATLEPSNANSLEGIPTLDIGSESKSSPIALNNVESETGSPSMYLDGSFEGLAQSYRKLSSVLNEPRCDELATYLDSVYSEILARTDFLHCLPRRKVYIAAGPTGLEHETFNYLQDNVFEYLNCECINNDVPCISIDENFSIIDLDELAAVDFDLIIFKDAKIESLEKEGEATRYLWENLIQMKQAKTLCAPSTVFSWIESPLVTQALGILWLGKFLYPDKFKELDLMEYASDFYRLFVHSEGSASAISQLISQSVVRL